MSKATFLKSLFGEIAPKAAAPAAGASLMFPSDDADAGLLNAGARASTKLASEIPGFRPPRVVERVSDRPRGVRTEYRGMSDADVSKAYQGLATKIEQGPPKGFRDDRSNTDPRDGFIADPERRQGAWEHYAVQGFMHEMTDYDRWGTIVRDGFDNGRGSSDTYKLGMDAMYEEMIERAPKSSHGAIEKYFRNRFRRESRDPFDNYNPNKPVADLDPIPGVVGKGDVPGSGSTPKNSIMEDALRGALEKESPTVGEPAKVNTGRSPVDRSTLKKGLLGTGAAGGKVKASEEDDSYLDTYFDDEYIPMSEGPRSPAEAGFPSFESYEPEPTMWEQAGNAVLGSLGTALEPWLPGGAVAESAVGKHVYGNVADVLDLTEIPARAAHGVARGGWGLMNGESPGQAFSQGMGTYNSTIDENAERLSTYVEGRGAHPDDVSAAYWGTLLSDPTNLLGLGITKNAVKGAIR